MNRAKAHLCLNLMPMGENLTPPLSKGRLGGVNNFCHAVLETRKILCVSEVEFEVLPSPRKS